MTPEHFQKEIYKKKIFLKSGSPETQNKAINYLIKNTHA